MIRCETPRALKHTLEEICYDVESTDQRAAREFLQTQPGVLGVEPAGAKLHLFLDAEKASPEALQQALLARGLASAEFRRIVPSLEDVFIGLVRKEEAAHAG